jgi:toxin secretion/phage lysis holin
MDKAFNLAVATLGVAANHLWGEWSPLLQVLVLFVLVDYSTGLMASGMEGKLNSKVGFRGIPKKVMIFAMVAIGHAIDRAIGDGHIFRDATIFFYLSNELLSIIENSGRIGLPVPDVLKRAVEVLKGRVKE